MAVSRAACPALVFVLAVSLTTAFNVDTAHPVIFRGPVTDPTGQQTRGDTYFGYSVSLAGVGVDGGPWLLAGAPRANSTLGLEAFSDIREPGVLFKCPLRRGAACQEVLVNRKGNEYVRRLQSFKHLKDQGWMGGTMDAEPGGTGRVAVSGFRWRNQRYSNQHLGNGICYVADSPVDDDTFQEFVPLVENTKQSFLLPDTYTYRHVYYYSYGQAATSIHFPENGRELILGAPGVFDWTGTLIRYSDFEEPGGGGGSSQRRRRQANQLEQVIIPNPFHTKVLQKYDYLGYSVGSGRFFGATSSTFYLAGAPRAVDGKGEVFLLDFPRNEYEPYEVMANWVGSTVGEYFGAAVLAVDLNGDELSDVVVGAPLFGEGDSFEQGRIYVYMNSDRAQFKAARTSVGSGAVRARFGTTLAALGDIDNDGFQDFAVGAPYEEDGRGAVYLFRGRPDDFDTTASQRIAASQLNNGLLGFGISISRGVDVDGNQYPDFAVGSYTSGDAVLLRTRPVLQFVATMTAEPKKLEATTREFEVRACLTFHGRFVPAIVPVNVILKVESLHAQSALVVNGQDVSSTSQRWKVTKDNEKCQRYTVAIRSEGSIDFTKPIQLSMMYDLLSTVPERSGERAVLIDTDTSKRAPSFPSGGRGKRQAPFPSDLERIDDFCNTCPLPNVNMDNQQLTLLNVPFAVGCGSDAVCTTDLKLAYSFLHSVDKNTYVIGSTKTLDLELRLTNGGEPASLPSLTLVVPPPLSLVRVPPSCQEHSPDQRHVSVTCTVQPHPFYDNSQFKIPLRFDVVDVTSQHSSVTFNVSATSTGVEINPRDNIANITLNLVSEADLEIVGKSFQDQVFYEKEEDRLQKDKGTPYYLDIEHTYQIFKYLPTPVEAAAISFLIPFNFNDDGKTVNFLSLYPPSAQIGGQPFSCSLKAMNFIRRDQTMDKGDELELIDQPARRRKRQADSSLEELRANGTHLLNCTSVQCVRMTCNLVSFLDTSTRATVKLSMRLDVRALRPLLTDNEGVAVVTHGFVHLLNGSRIAPSVNRRPDRTAVSTELLPSSLEPQPVASWIIAVAVLGALLLLALLAYIMHRAGFFKRTKRDQLLEEQHEVEETKRMSTAAE